MDTIRDMLSIGCQSHTLQMGYESKKWDEWVVWYWGDVQETRKVGSFPREDEAWGIVALILEYVEKHGYTPDRAIALALREYREAVAHSAACALDNEPDAAELGRMAHAHAMGYVP